MKVTFKPSRNRAWGRLAWGPPRTSMTLEPCAQHSRSRRCRREEEEKKKESGRSKPKEVVGPPVTTVHCRTDATRATLHTTVRASLASINPGTSVI